MEEENCFNKNPDYNSGGKNPLMIQLVLSILFSFLNSESLTSCRLVCKTWKSTCKPYLRKRSRIVFQVPDFADKVTYMDGFRQTFPINHPPFTSMKIKLRQIRISSKYFEEIFTLQKDVSDLELRNVVLNDENEQPISSYDITHLIPPKIKNICVINNSNGITQFMFSMSSVACTENVNLYKCTVNHLTGDKITAKEITMDHVVFQPFPLPSDCINFSHLAKLDYKDDLDRVDLSFVKYSRKAPAKITIDLTCTNILNPDWYTNEMLVSKINFYNYFTSIRSLTIRCSSIDLIFLPDTIEILHLGANMQIFCSQPISLISLKSLTISGNFTSLVHFSNCPNLVELKVSPDHSDACTFDLNHIPSRISRMKCSQDYRNKIDWIGNTTHKLASLIISDCTLNRLLEVLLDKFQPNEIVVNVNTVHVSSEDIFTLIQKPNLKSVAIGPIYWKEDKTSIYEGLQRFQELFTDSFLFSSVDKKSPYYLFTSGKGKTIDENEFYSML